MVKAGVGFKFLMRLSMVGEIGRSTIGGVLSVSGGVSILNGRYAEVLYWRR